MLRPFSSVSSKSLFTIFPRATSSPAVSSVPAKAPAFKGSGMKLGKKGKQSDLIDALGTEIATPNTSIPNTPVRAVSPERPRFQSNVEQERYVTIED